LHLVYEDGKVRLQPINKAYICFSPTHDSLRDVQQNAKDICVSTLNDFEMKTLGKILPQYAGAFFNHGTYIAHNLYELLPASD